MEQRNKWATESGVLSIAATMAPSHQAGGLMFTMSTETSRASCHLLPLKAGDHSPELLFWSDKPRALCISTFLDLTLACHSSLLPPVPTPCLLPDVGPTSSGCSWAGPLEAGVPFLVLGVLVPSRAPGPSQVFTSSDASVKIHPLP